MIADESIKKKLIQSKISSYFTVFKDFSNKDVRIRKRKMSRVVPRKARRKLSVESSEYYPSSSRMSSSLDTFVSKRKLVVQIFSEDEDSESENDQRISRTNQNHENAILEAAAGKPLASLNKSISDACSPEKQVKYWNPKVILTQLQSSCDSTEVLNSCKSILQNAPNDPCCSKTLTPYQICGNNNNLPSTSDDSGENSKKIRILTNQVIYSPKKTSAATSSPKGTPAATSSPKKTSAATSSPKETSAATSSPKKTSAATSSPSTDKAVKPEEKKINFKYLEVMQEFFKNILENSCLKSLLSSKAIEMLKIFFEIDRKYQYLCMKLFMWKPMWYNIFKYVEQINLQMNKPEIVTMYNCLKDNQFVETNYLGEDLFTLLNLLDLKDLREINRSFKFKNAFTNKIGIISKLLSNCKTQLTLTYTKSTEQVLRDRVKEKLGMCFKLSDELRRAFYYVYLLNTFTNPSIMKPQDYFRDTNIAFPKDEVEKYNIFYLEEDFLDYASAIELRQALDEAIEKKNQAEILEICNHSFDMLKKLGNKGSYSADDTTPQHLEHFTAQAQYISVLSNGLKHVTTSANNHDMRRWLEFLISQDYCKHKRGAWYCQLSLIYTTYLKDYKTAAQVIISAFEKEKDCLSEVQLHELAHRGEILDKKSYKLPTLFHDQIIAAGPPSCERDWPEVVVESRTLRGNEPGRKREYIREAANGDVSYLTVEQVALNHYLMSGFSDGEHCEGSLIRASFCLLFFDIIYDTYVRGTFVSKMQSVPLDMYTKYFYVNRERSIKIRLSDIKDNWSDEELRRFFMDNWEKHSHESLLCILENVTHDPERLFKVILCIGRNLLAKLLERLARNYKDYHSGFPDLIVWNIEEKRAKFVEVKGENDTLSIKQKLWLNYLMDNGAEVEVCHVHSRGSKKKIPRTKGKTAKTA